MHRRLPFLFLLLLLTATPSDARGRARERGPLTAHEPVESVHQTVLITDGVSARVATSGRDTRLRLRKRERLDTVAELRNGWAAAGVRRRKSGFQLVVWRDAAAGLERLPAPAGEKRRVRVRPRVLVDRGDFAGLAWMEGSRPDRMEIRAADWTGAAWGPSTVVSPVGPGSQSGLTQAILDDGSWLLVWSRFDGTDDELYWSRWKGSRWTAPRPVEAGDRVPDVAPTLVATEAGALLAWNEYDGESYRVRAAEFGTGGGGTWHKLGLQAEPGSLFPTFKRDAEGLRLLFRAGGSRGWAALSLDDDGTALGIARTDVAAKSRPVLRQDGPGNLVFEWPGQVAAPARWELLR